MGAFKQGDIVRFKETNVRLGTIEVGPSREGVYVVFDDKGAYRLYMGSDIEVARTEYTCGSVVFEETGEVRVAKEGEWALAKHSEGFVADFAMFIPQGSSRNSTIICQI